MNTALYLSNIGSGFKDGSIIINVEIFSKNLEKYLKDTGRAKAVELFAVEDLGRSKVIYTCTRKDVETTYCLSRNQVSSDDVVSISDEYVPLEVLHKYKSHDIINDLYICAELELKWKTYFESPQILFGDMQRCIRYGYADALQVSVVKETVAMKASLICLENKHLNKLSVFGLINSDIHQKFNVENRSQLFSMDVQNVIHFVLSIDVAKIAIRAIKQC